jgi:NTP pyrophosphatase (non-canonical NTP hydrolase)
LKTDKETTIDELKTLVRRFSEERDWDRYHNAKDLAIGIVTEGSELLQRFRFKSEAEVDLAFRTPASRRAINEEISDTFYFLLRLAQRYGVNLSTELNRKIEKNKVHYPVERAKGSNKKYTELQR